MGSLEVYYLEERPQSDEGPFLKEERHLLDAIAERLSRVVERFAAEKARRRRVQEVSTLHHVAQTMAAVGDLTEALEIAAEAVSNLFDARSTLFAVPDYEHAELQVLAGFERESGPYSTRGVAFSLDETPFTREALGRGQPILLPDFQAVSLAPSIQAFVRERDLQTMLFIPLRARGTVVGVLAVGSDRPGSVFSPDEIALAETIARRTVTYDLARQMEGATEVKCSEFAEAIVGNM